MAERLLVGVPAAVLLASFVSGCVAAVLLNSGPSNDEIAVMESETAPYRHGGNASIVGQLLIETAFGQMMPPAGNEVLLTPVTTYATKRFDKYVLKRNERPERIEAELTYWTRTDASGRFKFIDLAAGDYFLASEVFWAPPGSSDTPKRAIGYSSVHVAPGETVHTIVTRDVRS